MFPTWANDQNISGKTEIDVPLKCDDYMIWKQSNMQLYLVSPYVLAELRDQK